MPKKIDLSLLKENIIRDCQHSNLLKKDVSKKYNISTCTLTKNLRKWGVDVDWNLKSCPVSQDQIKEIIDIYLNDNLSVHKLASKFDCSDEFIREILVKNNIPRSNNRKDKVLGIISLKKDYIIDCYEKQNKSGWEIGKLLGVHGQTIYNYLNKWNIKLDKFVRVDLEEKKLEIINLFENEKLSSYEIGELYDAWPAVIIKYLKKWGVDTKSRNKTFGTYIEKRIEEILIRNKIDYLKQFQIEERYYDFYIVNCNAILEVNGDYWHGNPKVFNSKNLNKIQKNGKLRDRYKKKLSKI